MEAYYDRDVDCGALDGKTIAVIGYGSRGARTPSTCTTPATPWWSAFGRVKAIATRRGGTARRRLDSRRGVLGRRRDDADSRRRAARRVHARGGRAHPAGRALTFAHGFGIHFGTIVPPGRRRRDHDRAQGPGRLVRTEYEAGRGVPCLVAVHQDASGHARTSPSRTPRRSAAAAPASSRRPSVEETETDLFGEQAVLCGGMSALVKAGFETLRGRRLRAGDGVLRVPPRGQADRRPDVSAVSKACATRSATPRSTATTRAANG